MAVGNTKLLLAFCLTVTLCAALVDAQDAFNNYLDVEAPTPSFLSYNSPLRKPDSLRSRPYYDFLSTLYRRDSTKSNLFRPYERTRRDISAVEPAQPLCQLMPMQQPRNPSRQCVLNAPLSFDHSSSTGNRKSKSSNIAQNASVCRAVSSIFADL